jgi:hypothetical protein
MGNKLTPEEIEVGDRLIITYFNFDGVEILYKTLAEVIDTDRGSESFEVKFIELLETKDNFMKEDEVGSVGVYPFDIFYSSSSYKIEREGDSAKQKLAGAIDTLMWSWGGDTPTEAFWVLFEIVEFINKEYDQKFVAPTEEDYFSEEIEHKLNRIIQFLKN